MLKYSNFVIKYKNKVRNIKTYIHKTLEVYQNL